MSQSPSPAIVETRNIQLPQGGVLEVQLTQNGIDRIRQHFGLFGDQQPDDDQVRMYLWGAANTAVSKAEQEIKDAPEPARPSPGEPAGRARKPRRRKKAARAT